MKLTRISTDHYNGQSPCKRCNPTGSYSGYMNWTCMMVEFKEIGGHYCHKCAKEIEKEYFNKKDLSDATIAVGLEGDADDPGE